MIDLSFPRPAAAGLLMALLALLPVLVSAQQAQPQQAQEKQPMVIPLYPGNIPNSRPGPDEERSEVTSDGVLVISKISRPTLTIYQPVAGKTNGTAVVICPGGGYWVEAIDLEGTDFAKRFAAEGVVGIVLKYRIPNDETMIDRSIGALQDAQQAIKVAREHARAWGIDPRRIGIMGFSAGGHLAAMAATHFDKVLIPDADQTSVRPDFVILGYPVITCNDSSRHAGSCEQLIGKHPTAEQARAFSNELQVTDATPPAFLVHASDDTGVPPQNSILFYQALLRHHVPAELHLYEHSGHGFGLHLKHTQEDWMGRCFHWMEANGWMPATPPKLTSLRAQHPGFHNTPVTVELGEGDTLWRYHWGNGRELGIAAPVFELDGRDVRAGVESLSAGSPHRLTNGVHEQDFTGKLVMDTSMTLTVRFRWSDESPVIRFCYLLSGSHRHLFTKREGRDHLRYLCIATPPAATFKEIRLGVFNARDHAYHLQESVISATANDEPAAVGGPLLEITMDSSRLLLGYEHGSTYPDNFLQYTVQSDGTVSLDAVKGNYLDHQPVGAGNDYASIWFELCAIDGDEATLASQYRRFVLHDLAPDPASRRPYIYYNTWGRQERTKWAGGQYLSSMNLQTTLAEIETAHRLGIEVYVLDAGWFQRTGDWEADRKRFPDDLRHVKALLDRYSMRLGLWFNPTVAAISSDMLRRNNGNRMVWEGKTDEPFPVWETEKSVRLDLVSPYWIDFSNALIRLSRRYGVTYFKWDAVGQYGCDGAGHYHGTETNSRQERADSYAFQLPQYLSRIADRLRDSVPGVIVDFDITEPGRSMGLGFLSSGKYFIMNNGPYFSDYDLAPPGKTPLTNGNVNIFVNPGPARGRITRSVLTFDKWIPSVLFLTHYQMDAPRTSQQINLASLVLGQNGIWGQIDKVPAADVAYIHEVLQRYKQVRDDITAADPVFTGQPGDSPEIVEKIDAASGRGVVSLFAGEAGRYVYRTAHRVDRRIWASAGVDVSFDSAGHAVISLQASGDTGAMVFFGAD